MIENSWTVLFYNENQICVSHSTVRAKGKSFLSKRARHWNGDLYQSLVYARTEYNFIRDVIFGRQIKIEGRKRRLMRKGEVGMASRQQELKERIFLNFGSKDSYNNESKFRVPISIRRLMSELNKTK